MTRDLDDEYLAERDQEVEEGTSRKRGPSQADLLLQLADQGGYWFGTSTRGEPFGVVDGESIARPLHDGRGSVRAELARLFAEKHGKAPSANALADTMLALEGRAYAGEERDLALRVARHGDVVWLDLGTVSGELVQITAGGWQVAGGGPLYRRTRLTGALPEPARDGDLAELRSMLRVTDEVWPLIAAWLACVLLLPAQPVPVLVLTGEHGTAKSWQSRLLVQLADPSDSPLRTAPRDVESWAVAASASRVVALDNVSRIEPWLSDCLCRAVTGDGLVRRALYSDSDVSVIAFRRAVLLNGIALTGLRGDLADRLLRAELDQLDDTERLEEAEAEKLEKSRRWEERVQRDHQAGRISAMDIARMWQEREDGDPGRIAVLERRAASLRGQLQEMTARISAPQARQHDPVEEAGRRAHQAFIEATRAVLEAAPAPRKREPRPFAGPGSEGAPDCAECAAAGASRSESAAIHAEAVR